MQAYHVLEPTVGRGYALVNSASPTLTTLHPLASVHIRAVATVGADQIASVLIY